MSSGNKTLYYGNGIDLNGNEKYMVFWLSDYHATFNCYADLGEAEQFRDKLLALEDTGGTFRGRMVTHVVLSSR